MGLLGNFAGKVDEDHLNTIIGEGTTLDGVLSVIGSVRIDGSLRGKLDATGNLTVGSKGLLVSPTVTCKSAHVAGNVTGDLISPQKVYLTSSAKLDGNIRTQVLVIEEGAVFNGKTEMIGTQQIAEIQPENAQSVALDETKKSSPSPKAKK